MSQRGFLTTRELAERLGISPRQLRLIVRKFPDAERREGIGYVFPLVNGRVRYLKARNARPKWGDNPILEVIDQRRPYIAEDPLDREIRERLDKLSETIDRALETLREWG